MAITKLGFRCLSIQDEPGCTKEVPITDRSDEGNGNTTNVLDTFTASTDKWFEHLPLKNFPVLSRLQPAFNEIIVNPDDGLYWAATRTDLTKINAPVLQFGG